MPTPTATLTLLIITTCVSALLAWWAALHVDDRRRRRRLQPLAVWLGVAHAQATQNGTRMLLVVVEGEQAWVFDPPPATATPAAAVATAGKVSPMQAPRAANGRPAAARA